MTGFRPTSNAQVPDEHPDASIDRLIVRLATWGATVFLGMILVGAIASRDPAPLAQGVTPAAIAVYGWFMLWRGRPRAVLQLVLGIVGVVAAVTLAPEIVAGDPIFGLLVMSIVGTMLTRRRVGAFAAVAIVSLALSSIAFDPVGTSASDQVTNASVAVIAYVIPAWLLVYLKRRSEKHQRELEALIESKDQFVATVSHELRTPLTTIVGLALELESRFDDFSKDEVQDFVSMLVGEGTDVANIVEDLLVAARADIGTLALTCTWLSLEEELAAATGEDPTVPIDSGAIPGTASIYADGLRFRQIIRNLIANASRYGGDQVRIALHGTGEFALIEVRDSGGAIPLEDRDRIFEPYHTSARSGALPGSAGLGLTVSRRLARLMDGDVSYHHDGDESVFTLRLPASFAEPRLAVAGA